MKIIFLSNYLNHHQLSLCKALEKLTDGNFRFIATSPVSNERLKLGYDDMNKKYPFVVTTYDSDDRESTEKMIMDADAVIIGSAPDKYVVERLKQNKLVFRYSERIYKNGVSKLRVLYHRIKFYPSYIRYKNQYLLCASAFAAADYAKTGSFIDKTYKWGYFPEAKHYDVESLVEHKKSHSILWIARFIDWKHPEACIKLAKKLLTDGITDFNISMIGNGVMLEQIKEQIVSEHLENNISVLGSMTPDEARRHMEDSEIFIFTSDRNEGWGAVLNESMNSGCAVVASSEIGAVPYLINDGENGFIYQDGSIDDLYKKVKDLYFDSDKRKRFGVAAYHTIADLWNADVAAERLLLLINDLETTGTSNRFQTGPCSKAEIIKDGWYKC